MATFVMFREHDGDARVVINPEEVRFVRELPDRRVESAVQIAFGDNLSVIVKSDLESALKALTDSDRT